MPRVSLAPSAAGDRLGCSVAAFQDWAVVGACKAARGAVPEAGAVHSFRLSSKQSGGRVLSPVAHYSALFGSALAMGRHGAAGLLLVGSMGEDVRRGVVYVFQFALDSTLLNAAGGGSSSALGALPSALPYDLVHRLTNPDG